MERRPRERQRIRRGVGFIAFGALCVAATAYYTLNPDYGWLYALLFTALPAAVGLGVGIRELVLLAKDRATPVAGPEDP